VVPPPSAVQPTAAAPPLADPDGPRPYIAATLTSGGAADAFVTTAAAPLLQAQIRHLLAVEAPIAFTSLARRVAEAWGIARVTERVRERLRDVLPDDACLVDEVVWLGADEAAAFRGFRVPGDAASLRAADDLPIAEVVNAMQWLLRQHAALADEDLAREAARCFGIQRLGSVVRDVMARALEQLVASGRGRRDGDLLRLP
jgi:hypothetical protein